MEHTVDDTAKAILEWQGDDAWCEYANGSMLPSSDLQAMARLWLLLPEIREALDAEAVSAFYTPLFDKIEAIAGEYE